MFFLEEGFGLHLTVATIITIIYFLNTFVMYSVADNNYISNSAVRVAIFGSALASIIISVSLLAILSFIGVIIGIGISTLIIVLITFKISK